MLLDLFKRVEKHGCKLREGFFDKGQGMIDYAIILAVIAVISVAVFMNSGGGGYNFGNSVEGIYQQSSDTVNKIEVPGSKVADS